MRPSIPQRWRLPLALLSLLLLIGLALGTLWATNALGWRRWRIQEAQAFIGAALPPEASAIQFATQDAHTRILWLRFALPAGVDLSGWLAGVPLEAGFTPFPQPNPQETALPWWTPQVATTYSGLHRVTAGQVFEVLVDQSDSAAWVVYLRVYNTA